jgi:adenylate cyclase
MAEEPALRRLAVVMAADVVGYSRMMERDENGTLNLLKARRKAVFQPTVDKHRGRVVKLMGDGALVEFASAVNAVACAIDLQGAMAAANADLPEDRRIVLRIGLDLGDVLVEGSDLYGEGVNIASRLETLAEPGSVFLSQAVFSHVRGRVPFRFEDLGERSLKNMVEPVRVFRVSDPVALPDRVAVGKAERPARLSIAVLPFVNMSGDPEQEYFSDGITEDIITDLSKVSTLKVLSRNTAFTFKGRTVETGQIARQLNVEHVLEGSVRKAGGRVRITAQLVDTGRDSHVWSERYDRNLNDIFALQDEIAQAVVSALKVRLLPEERKAIENRSTRDPAAYEVYLQGRYHYIHFSAKSLQIAIRFGQRALEIDPRYALAWALIAICQSALRVRGVSEDPGLAAAERALALDPTLAEAHCAKARVLSELGRYDEAFIEFEQSLRLDPDSSEVRYNFGRACFQRGLYEAALEHFERAAQLDEGSYASLAFVAQICQALGRDDEARNAAFRGMQIIEREVAARPDNALALSFGVGLLIQLGEMQRAREWISRTLIVEPDDAIIHYNLACNLAQLGECEQALDQLERAVDETSGVVIDWARHDSDFAPLRDHPRYRALTGDRAAARDSWRG